MILYDDKPVTANAAAKLLVLRYGEGAYYWSEKNGVDVTRVTAREVAAINHYVDHHWGRVKLFLGL